MQWLTRIFPRARRYNDLAVSIKEHLAERTDELMASGLSPSEAENAARREFGNVTLIEEHSREVWRLPVIDGLLPHFVMDCAACFMRRASL